MFSAVGNTDVIISDTWCISAVSRVGEGGGRVSREQWDCGDFHELWSFGIFWVFVAFDDIFDI